MGSFKLGKMTMRSLFHKPATVKYPYEKRDLERMFPDLRGHVQCDIDTCILCGICSRACPVGAIAVDRKGGTWEIDPYRCVQCASCVRECPKKCLSMSTECAPATTELSVTTIHKPAAPAKGAAVGGAGAGAGAAGAASGQGARPKSKLTPEQEARVAAARARKAAKDAAAVVASAGASKDDAAAEAPAAKSNATK